MLPPVQLSLTVQQAQQLVYILGNQPSHLVAKLYARADGYLVAVNETHDEVFIEFQNWNDANLIHSILSTVPAHDGAELYLLFATAIDEAKRELHRQAEKLRQEQRNAEAAMRAKVDAVIDAAEPIAPLPSTTSSPKASYRREMGF